MHGPRVQAWTLSCVCGPCRILLHKNIYIVFWPSPSPCPSPLALALALGLALALALVLALLP